MVWNFDKNTRHYNFKGHNDSVTCVEYSPNGEFLASYSEDQTLLIWVTKQSQIGTCLEMRAHLSPIRCLAFAPQGNQVPLSQPTTSRGAGAGRGLPQVSRYYNKFKE
ncbi:POC1 centriolar protein homolog A-like Protein [Tribolium castaneum]|uniref:POC1 centriolar protein homolog A-like Protein n=1 Tax=Tribolium castaneum TaxID=7070 RepID=D7EKA1_TRICA|nr:POC1 centriolar protein homolog A-like Protein [Tribolium castaneum]